MDCPGVNVVDVGIGNYRRCLILPFITVFSFPHRNQFPCIRPAGHGLKSARSRSSPRNILVFFSIKVVVQAAAYIQPLHADLIHYILADALPCKGTGQHDCHYEHQRDTCRNETCVCPLILPDS